MDLYLCYFININININMYRLKIGLEENIKFQRDQKGNILSTIKKQRFMIYQVPCGIHLHIDEYNNASGDFMKIIADYLKTADIIINPTKTFTGVIYNLRNITKHGRIITQEDLQLLEPFEDYCRKYNIDFTELQEKYEKIDQNGNITIHYQTYMDMFDSDFEDDDYYNNEYIGGYWNVTRNKNKEYYK